MLIEKYLALTLKHKVDLVRSRARSPILVAAASAAGVVSLIGPQFKLVSQFKTGSPITGLSIHPSQNIIAVVSGESAPLRLLNERGTLLAEFSSAGGPKDYLDCLFDQDGANILCVSRTSPEEIVLELFPTDRQGKANSLIMEDPFINSFCGLNAHNERGPITLMLAAGQDGQQGYWVWTDPMLRVQIEEVLADTTTPVFSPDGDSFLTIKSEERIVYYGYPALQPINWRGLDLELGDRLGVDQAFIGKSTAVSISYSGRAVLFDLDNMAVFDEILIAMHETKVFESVVRVDDSICFVLGEQAEEMKDTFISVPLSSVQESLFGA